MSYDDDLHRPEDQPRNRHEGDWRNPNLQAAPFDFPSPLFMPDEKCTEAGGAFADECLAVWHLDKLPLHEST